MYLNTQCYMCACEKENHFRIAYGYYNYNNNGKERVKCGMNVLRIFKYKCMHAFVRYCCYYSVVHRKGLIRAKVMLRFLAKQKKIMQV